jgi:predicted nuclease with TOPRIM domain
MLEEKDFKKIGEEMCKVIEENVLPVIEKLDKRVEGLEGRFDNLEGRFDNLEGRFDNLEGSVANLPDKAFLTDKLADLEGSVIVRQKKEDEKGNLLIKILHKQAILRDEEIKSLEQIQVFPRPPQ